MKNAVNDRKVSVIVPVYNVEDQLDKCLDSLIRQTYPEIEIILVDDGSTDASLSICRKYQQKDNRIIVLQNKRGGYQLLGIVDWISHPVIIYYSVIVMIMLLTHGVKL